MAKKEKIPVVEIQISGGIAEVMTKPKGVKVIITDHDTDGCCPEEDDDLLGSEEDGYYFEKVYEAKEKV